ncbi:MAG: aminotransferase class IV, partial [Pseudomonadota bacterium]
KENLWADGAAWMYGELMPLSQARLPVTDWGLTHSDITYDVVHAWDGKFFRLDDYLQRFEASLQKCRLSVPETSDDIRRILHRIVARSGLRESYVSMVVSRGQPRVNGSRDPRDCVNHFYAWCVPFVWVFTKEVIARGAKLYIDDDVQRISSDSVNPTAKNYHWGDFTQALLNAKEAEFDNTVLLDANGCVTEGPGFNLFIIKDNKVSTPAHGVLEGITRKVAIEICRASDLSVSVEDISLQQLFDADEVFATTTGGGIVPVTKVNQRIYSNAAAGEITTRLQEEYWRWHNEAAMSESIDYDNT